MQEYFNLINWDSLVDVLKALAVIGAGGGVMSLITSALVGSTWPSPAKALVAFLLCIIGAFIPIVIAGVDLTNMALVLPLMWVGSQAFYRLWFKPHGIAPWIETLFFNTKNDGPELGNRNEFEVFEAGADDDVRYEFERRDDRF